MTNDPGSSRTDARDPADVDGARPRHEEARQSRSDVSVDAECFAEISSGAAGDESQDRVRSRGAVGAEESIDGFIDGAVAADRNDLVVTFAQCILDESGRLAAAAGERKLEAGKRGFESARDRVPVSSGSPVARVRIDHDEGGHAASRVSNQGRSDSISLCRRSWLQPSSEPISRDAVSSTCLAGKPNWPMPVR